jgi:hypothetical protein
MTGITIEHAQIVEWTQSRGGAPAFDKSAEYIRPIIHFENENDASRVSWEEWMAVFEKEWAFIYQDRTSEGEMSRSWKIVPRFAREPHWPCDIKPQPER